MKHFLSFIIVTVYCLYLPFVSSEGQHGLDTPTSQTPGFENHSHGLERRTTLTNHHNFINKRSHSNSTTKKVKKIKKTKVHKKCPSEEEEEEEEEEEGNGKNNKNPPSNVSPTSSSGKTSSSMPSNMQPGMPPFSPPSGSSGQAPPSTTSSTSIKTNNGKPNDMPAVGQLKTMKYGWDDGGSMFASVWDDKRGGTYTAKSDNDATYTVTWNGVDDIVIGKGWITGTTDRVVEYSGTFDVNGNGAYLSLYGWSTNDCVEYYVTESWGIYKPCGSSPIKGTLESDGDTYTVCLLPQSRQCIDGSNGFKQFWSERNNKRTSGTITFANHVKAWQSFGMKLGSLNKPQIMAVEAYAGSSGSATITVKGSSGNIISGKE